MNYDRGHTSPVGTVRGRAAMGVGVWVTDSSSMCCHRASGSRRPARAGMGGDRHTSTCVQDKPGSGMPCKPLGAQPSQLL